MQFYPLYEQRDGAKVDEFVQSAPYCQLITTSEEGGQHVGIFNHVYRSGEFMLHLHRGDEQIADLKRSPRALIVVHEFHATIPSHWVDEKYAGAATSYYRYAEFDCTAVVYDSDVELTRVFHELMKRHQPEGGYTAIEADSPVYRKSYDMLAVVRLRVESVRTKWKLGQNRTSATRESVAARLEERGRPGDAEAAERVRQEIRQLD